MIRVDEAGRGRRFAPDIASALRALLAGAPWPDLGPAPQTVELEAREPIDFSEADEGQAGGRASDDYDFNF